MAEARDARATESVGNGLVAYHALASAIVARHLQTELADAECIDWDEAPAAAARKLRDLNFDQAPVMRGGRLIGYVATKDLAAARGARMARYVRRLGPDTFTSANASVLEVMSALSPDVAMTFVVEGHRVSGFVTPSDLNRHPARAHFYLLLTDLEIALAGLVRVSMPDQLEAVRLLHRQSQGSVLKRFRTDQRNNVETDHVGAMNLGHLLRVVGKTDLRTRFGAPDEDTWNDWTDGFRSLRDAVMHPTLEFLGPSRPLVDLIGAEARIRGMLKQASGP